MTREREGREAARGMEIVRGQPCGALEHAVRLDVVRRVAGLAGPLLVRESEQVEAAHVLRAAAQARLQLQDERLGISRGEPGGELVCLGGRLRAGGRRSAVRRQPAEEE